MPRAVRPPKALKLARDSGQEGHRSSPKEVDPTPEDWTRQARENARDAEALAARRSWRNAYMLAGLAVECALKGRLMQQLRLNRWPTRKERPEFYTHDLTKLADLAGVKGALEDAAAKGEPLASMWLVAKDFAINLRYPSSERFPVRLGRDMVEAVTGRNGLVAWLTQSTRSTK